MYPPNVLFPLWIKVLCEYAFAVAVDKEVDAAGRDDSDEVGSQAFEQSPKAFLGVYAAEQLAGLGYVEPCCAGNGEQGRS